MADYTPKERITNALDNRKLNLSAPTPGHKGKTAALVWGLYSNNPRITVWTNDPNDTGKSNSFGKISANLDMPMFYMVMGYLTKAIESPVEVKYKFENKGTTWYDNKPSQEPALLSELWVGKDKDGIVWISVQAPSGQNRPRIKFTFAPNDFHHLLHGDGTPISAAEASTMFAKGYVCLLEKMMSVIAANNWVAPVKKDQSGGNNKGSYNNNNGGGNRSSGGGNTGGNSGMEEEDMPF